MRLRLSCLGDDALRRRLRTGELLVRIPPFTVRIRSRLSHVADLLALLYADYLLGDEDAYQDFRFEVRHTNVLRRFVRPSAVFDGDGESPFAPMPASRSFPLFEWGFNWRVATTAHQYLMLHAAVVEHHGVSVVMPALPGSGKSTLAAALMCRGWRLLSDEFGLIAPEAAKVTPFPRPIPLKNESIPLLAALAPTATMGPVFHGTRKGDVAHLRPSSDSISRAEEIASVTHVVFPRYVPGTTASFHVVPKARAFLKISTNSFNYTMLGIDGFRTVARLVDQSSCYSFVYGDLEESVAAFHRFLASARPSSMLRPKPVHAR